MPTTYRTIFLSDLHLGMHGCQAERLFDFLRAHEAERWVLVGDVVDGWALARNWRWPVAHGAVVHALLDKARRGAEVVYVPGNHDGALRPFAGTAFGGIRLEREIVHETADGRRLLVIHGDEFDGMVRHVPWLSRAGAQLYEAALWANTRVSAVRARLGLDYRSLAAALKGRTKAIVQYVGRFEDAVGRRAAERGVDGVVCGHIHHAELREIDAQGKTVLYANCGDWVESCTALVEHADGALELVGWTAGRPATRAAPVHAVLARHPLPGHPVSGDGAVSRVPTLDVSGLDVSDLPR